MGYLVQEKELYYNKENTVLGGFYNHGVVGTEVSERAGKTVPYDRTGIDGDHQSAVHFEPAEGDGAFSVGCARRV